MHEWTLSMLRYSGIRICFNVVSWLINHNCFLWSWWWRVWASYDLLLFLSGENFTLLACAGPSNLNYLSTVSSGLRHQRSKAEHRMDCSRRWRWPWLHSNVEYWKEKNMMPSKIITAHWPPVSHTHTGPNPHPNLANGVGSCIVYVAISNFPKQ